jgi:PTS system ascorbate-specific IIB component
MEADSVAQVVMITPELQDQIKGIRSEIIVVNNIFDLAELTEKLEASLG